MCQHIVLSKATMHLLFQNSPCTLIFFKYTQNHMLMTINTTTCPSVNFLSFQTKKNKKKSRSKSVQTFHTGLYVAPTAAAEIYTVRRHTVTINQSYPCCVCVCQSPLSSGPCPCWHHSSYRLWVILCVRTMLRLVIRLRKWESHSYTRHTSKKTLLSCCRTGSVKYL